MIIKYQPVIYASGGTRYYLLLDLEIISLGQNYSTKALVDSGADTSLFALEILADAGVDITRCPPAEGHVADGRKLTMVHHPVEVVILNKKIKLDADWVAMKGQSFNLLGRHDFFRHFKIAFNERAHFMEINPY